MKGGISVQLFQTMKGKYSNHMRNFMPMNLTTQMQTDFLKDTNTDPQKQKFDY